jgi:ribosomal protein S12 methylthiotransferase accessory factor
LLPRFGITRVTEITRLDRLGLPVFISVRPRGRLLSVHAGKGVHADEARVGAMMEALEHAAAERHRSPAARVQALTLAALQDRWQGRFQWVDLAPPLDLKPAPSLMVPAITCDDLCGGEPAPLPAELIFLPWDAPAFEPFFGASGNGLASGNSVTEATLHALFELMERDAVALNAARDASRWVPPDSLPMPFSVWAAAWAAAGVNLAVRELPNTFGLPCFQAVLHEALDNPVDLAGGFGLHVHAEVALARAVCEAAQSRAGLIHGGRDDVQDFFAKYRLPESQRTAYSARAQQALFDQQRQVRFDELPVSGLKADGLSLDDLLALLLARLRELGFGAVFRHCFEVDLDGLAVVKLLVPGLEHLEQPCRRMGPRLLAQVVGRA